MKVSAILASATATLVLAVPTSPPLSGCHPGTYACDGAHGWKTCNTSGQWVFAGNCPPDTVCRFYPPSSSPYCVPPTFQFP
ncbi:hypothetical protein S40285_06723 [Stachybotrys chlorohalonatus IBT 40285]|uniref:CBM1 domain-containing protein n=1 Tax=Stachybotrys chlorohalonatus (strain IBT 40285) TaxID=1283841 RepID=A0A084QTG8_STAC4|nr:hypothetical protein S40285_06723 [Stachybotrys chlorohalonata IBT 40285]